MPIGIRRNVRKVRRRLDKLRRRLGEPFDRWRAAWHAYGIEAARSGPGMPTVGRLDLWRDFVPWYRSQGHSALDEAQPWMTFEAVRMLGHRIESTTRVFEYGSGGSTLFLGRRAGQVVSVEHDPAWFAKIHDATDALPVVDVILAPARAPRTEAETAISSTGPGLEDMTFADYVAVADRFPSHYFDVLVVDGRARPSAFFAAEAKVRVGGLVILDDSERVRYGPIVEAATAAGWVERGRYGPRPYTKRFGRTTLWTKTSDVTARADDGIATMGLGRMAPRDVSGVSAR